MNKRITTAKYENTPASKMEAAFARRLVKTGVDAATPPVASDAAIAEMRRQLAERLRGV